MVFSIWRESVLEKSGEGEGLMRPRPGVKSYQIGFQEYFQNLGFSIDCKFPELPDPGRLSRNSSFWNSKNSF